MGFNPEFSMVCSNILSLDPFPSLNKIYYMVIHELGPEAAVYYVEEGPGANQPDTGSGGRPYCYHCDRMGHTRSTCWKLRGKPADWEPKNKGKNGAKQLKKRGSVGATVLGISQV
ncbi:hypothetical protein CRG98_007028 [Punica granatum]|uniref:CCHC-type domain-containing protein n=1 Tax=Punica granatum TaxID=22663 RepID=A0A2I0KW12_PUNGR|nr:hypothetical protein CRG98_007028 [Punica granatum]